MAGILALLAIGVVCLVLGGSVCGIVAFARTNRLQDELRQARQDTAWLRTEVSRLTGKTPAAKTEAPVAVPDPAAKEAILPRAPVLVSPPPPPLPEIVAPPSAPLPEPKPDSPLSLELRMGTRWIIWLGAVIFLGGVAWALKYTYDNNLIGPSGRLALGALTGIAALVTGEYYRRRRMPIPFQAFTGAGAAILYLCIFFSFQVYHLTGAGISMALAVGVTGLAIALSVLHNALPIALLAVTGGYMSPVFLSTGQDAPYTLFTYVAILNLVALGAAFFRRWRALDLFCLAGTALLYQGWAEAYFKHPEGLVPALTFITLFYVMFMAAPMVYGLLRRVPETVDSLVLLVGNSLFWLFCYYEAMFSWHRNCFGYVVLAQALFVLLLYLLWMKRVQGETKVAISLLGISLSLFTLVIPILLRFDFVPIAWAAQGVLLLWLGYRFANVLCALSGKLLLALSVGVLVSLLPLHEVLFTPVFNKDFGSWAFVIACLAAASAITRQAADPKRIEQSYPAAVLAMAALVLTCALLTMETYHFFTIRGGNRADLNLAAALTLLWTFIPLLLTLAAVFLKRVEAAAMAQLAWIVGLFVFLTNCAGTRDQSTVLLLNLYAFPKLVFILALWTSVVLFKRFRPESAGPAWLKDSYDACKVNAFLELAGHASLVLLTFAEMVRWGAATTLISRDMAIGIVSAIWALHACVLIWHGLVSRAVYRRYAGFLLFAVAVSKTVLVDAFNLAGVYRIISWLGVGILLVVAALLYQRYSAILLAEDSENADDNSGHICPGTPQDGI